MREYGMDVRILGLLVSSDYHTLPSTEYATLQASIGKGCADTIYKVLADSGFKVSFNATVYEIASELIRIASNLMFGNELQFSNVKYHVDGDLCSLDVTVNTCPVCEYVESDHQVCDLLSGFLAGLMEAFLSRFADVKVDSREISCIARGDPYCSFTTKWRTPVGLPPIRGYELEIHVDERALNEKVNEILALDFYQKALAYARQRRSLTP